MSDIVPKEMRSMILSQLFGQMNIMQTPSVKGNKSFVPRLFEKKKIRDYEQISDSIAKTEGNKLRALNAQIDQAISLFTAKDKYELKVREIEHEHKRLDHQLVMWEVEEMQGKANLKKTLKEGELLDMELESQKLDLLIKRHSLKETLHDIEDEDRD
jgi:hypothetical protein